MYKICCWVSYKANVLKLQDFRLLCWNYICFGDDFAFILYHIYMKVFWKQFAGITNLLFRFVQPIVETANPSLVEPLLNLLATVHLEVQYEGNMQIIVRLRITK